MRWEDESNGKQSMLLDYIIIGVGQENKSPRPHFDPNKLPSKDGGRSGNFGGVTTNVLGVTLPSLIETWLKVHFCQKILIFLS